VVGGGALLPALVDALAGVCLRGFDLESVLREFPASMRDAS
jgi:hypothetical protein